MKLSDLLPREHIFAPLESKSFHEALAEMVRGLATAGVVRDPAALERALTGARSRDVATIGAHVALPHLRTDSVDRIVVALGVARQPLAARDARMEKSPRVVVLILAHPRSATLYLQTVSALVRLFRQEDVVERVIAAPDADEVLRLTQLDAVQIHPRLTVRDVMIHRGETIAPTATVRDAVDIMVRKRVRALPVVGEKGEVMGIISEYDVMRALLPQIPRGSRVEGEERPDPPTLRVKDIMTRSVLCISEDLGLDEAASMMINKDVEQFPVVTEGKLAGFLSRSDIIRKLFGR